MILAAHQPAHLPWPGYLDRIARADVFVFLDAVQFEKNSFTNRNRIKTASGVQWLTIPVLSQGHLGGTVQDMAIDERGPWRAKQAKSIEAAYARAPAFTAVFPQVRDWIMDPTPALADYCWTQLLHWVAAAGITTRLLRQSALGVTSRKSDLVLDLCLAVGADQYLSGPLGRDYLQLDSFAQAGITVGFHDFAPPVYPQLWGDFVPGLSVLDLWMNTGHLPFHR